MNSYLYFRYHDSYDGYYRFGSTDNLRQMEKEFSQHEFNNGYFEHVYQFPLNFAHYCKDNIYNKYQILIHTNKKTFCRKTIIPHLNKYLTISNETFIKLNYRQIHDLIKNYKFPLLFINIAAIYDTNITIDNI